MSVDPAEIQSEFLERQRQEIRERIEFIEPLVRELPLLRAGLRALNGGESEQTELERVKAELRNEQVQSRTLRGRLRKLELQSERKEAPDGGAKTPLSPNGGPGVETSGADPSTMVPPTPGEAPPEPQPVETANGRKQPVSVKIEQVRDWVVGQTGPFSTSDVARALNISPITAKRKLDDLPAGMIRRPAGSPSQGGHARWEYVPVDPTSGPRRRPRGEDWGPREAAAPVAHTGRPKGPSDKATDRQPGQLRRRKKGGAVMRIGGKT